MKVMDWKSLNWKVQKQALDMTKTLSVTAHLSI